MCQEVALGHSLQCVTDNNIHLLTVYRSTKLYLHVYTRHKENPVRLLRRVQGIVRICVQSWINGVAFDVYQLMKAYVAETF